MPVADALLATLRRPWARGESLRGASVLLACATLDAVVALARPAGLLPLVAARLLDDGPALAPALEAELRAARALGVAHAARARVELGEAAAALAAAGVEAVAIKGPALEATLGLAGPRAASDLDLWLPRPADLPAAVAALAPLGLAPAVAPPGGGAVLRAVTSSGMARLELDLHVALVDPLVRPRGPRPGPAERAAPGPAAVRTLDAAWTLLLAAVHLHKDLFALRRLVDLAGLLRVTPPAARARALALARALGLSTVLRAGAGLAVEWLGAPDPGWGRRPSTWLQARALARLATPTAAAGRAAPTTDRARAAAHLLRWALLDDAARVAPDRLLRLAWPPSSYARARGGRLARLARLVGRFTGGRP